MKGKIEDILKYPLKGFSKDIVLKIVIYSIFTSFILLSINNMFSFITNVVINKDIHYPSFEHNYYDVGYYFTLFKDSLYQIITILLNGYFISKYKFCYWSIMGYYGIVYIKSIWFVNKYIYEMTYFLAYINFAICFVLLAGSIVYFIKQKGKIKDGKSN